MPRTVISLEVADKLWLDKRASSEGVPMTEIVRRAIRAYRTDSRPRTPLKKLAKLRGSWQRGDGLAYQQAMREEWGR